MTWTMLGQPPKKNCNCTWARNSKFLIPMHQPGNSYEKLSYTP